MTTTIDEILEQMGEIPISKHHYGTYKLVPPTLNDLLSNVIMAGITANGTRATDDPIISALNIMIFDHDGKEETLRPVIKRLREEGITFLLWISPSYKKSYDTGLRKYRLLVPTTDGLTPSNYKYNLLALGKLVGMSFDKAWDVATLKIKQPIYPPIMRGVKEPKDAPNKKPKDLTYGYVLPKVKSNLGNQWKTRVRFTSEEKEVLEALIPKPESSTNINGTKYGNSDIEYVPISGDTILTLNGIKLGTFDQQRGKQLFEDAVIRCDCPFDSSEHSDDGKGQGYGYMDSIGQLHCRSSHDHLRGVLPENMPKNEELPEIDLEELFV